MENCRVLPLSPYNPPALRFFQTGGPGHGSVHPNARRRAVPIPWARSLNFGWFQPLLHHHPSAECRLWAGCSEHNQIQTLHLSMIHKRRFSCRIFGPASYIASGALRGGSCSPAWGTTKPKPGKLKAQQKSRARPPPQLSQQTKSRCFPCPAQLTHTAAALPCAHAAIPSSAAVSVSLMCLLRHRH